MVCQPERVILVKKGTGKLFQFGLAHIGIFFWKKVCYPTQAFVTLYTNQALPKWLQTELYGHAE
jgi:hypothetical protein